MSTPTNNSQVNQEKKINPLENPIIYLPIYFEMMSKCDIKIFKYLCWGSKNLNEMFFSEKHLALKCEVSEKTVQRFFKKYKNILIFLKTRPYKTYLISIPKVVSYYINKNGGFKIISNFSYHKARLINMAFNDPNSNDLHKSYKQSVNKTDEKMSTPPQKKCPPNLSSVSESLILDDNVLYGASNLQNEEILLGFGLNETQIVKINNDFGSKYVKRAIDDSLWYSKIGKKVYNQFGFILSRAKEHTIKDFMR